MDTLVDHPFSYSDMDAFDTCPKLYHAEKIERTIPFQESEAMSSGKRQHKALELYIAEGAEVPPGMTHVTKIVDKLATGADMIIPERKIAIRSDLTPCGFYDKDYCYRGVIDLTFLHPKIAVIGDLKTGSQPRETFMQLRLNSLAVFSERPEIEVASLWYIYTKFPPRRKDMQRSEIPTLLTEVNPMVARMQEAKASGQYPAKPCWKCSFCPLVSCPYNKKRK